MSNLVKPKDSQWLRVDVCREFQRDGCPRSDVLCKNAHPKAHIEMVDGKVMACYDSCKGRCTREVCKYYHPSPEIMEQLLLKGRNNLTSKETSAKKVPSTSPVYIPETTTGLIPINLADPPVNVFQPECGLKRSADVLSDHVYQPLFCKRQALEIPYPFIASYQPVFQIPAPAETTSVIPLNASFVNYTDTNGQLLDNLPVCQDFSRSMCTRVNCKFVHLLDPKKLEIHEQRVAVCRDHANSICRRQQCKYYHIPIQLPPAQDMASSFGGK